MARFASLVQPEIALLRRSWLGGVFGLLVACSSTTTVSVPAAATDAGETEDAAVQPEEPDAAAPDAAPDSGAKPALVPSATVGQSCNAFCASKKTTCTASCPLPSGAVGAGVSTSIVDIDNSSKTTEYATCAQTVTAAPNAISTTASCCCLTTPAKTVEKKLTAPSTCAAQCTAAGLASCEGGRVTYTRSDGTTCDRSVTCDEDVSPTSNCAQKASVSASLACTCR